MHHGNDYEESKYLLREKNENVWALSEKEIA